MCCISSGSIAKTFIVILTIIIITYPSTNFGFLDIILLTVFSVLKLQAQSVAAPKLKSGSTLFSAEKSYKEFFDVPITVGGYYHNRQKG